MQAHCSKEDKYVNQKCTNIGEIRKRLNQRLNQFFHALDIIKGINCLLGITLIVLRGRKTLTTLKAFSLTDPKDNSKILYKFDFYEQCLPRYNYDWINQIPPIPQISFFVKY